MRSLLKLDHLINRHTIHAQPLSILGPFVTKSKLCLLSEVLKKLAPKKVLSYCNHHLISNEPLHNFLIAAVSHFLKRIVQLCFSFHTLMTDISSLGFLLLVLVGQNSPPWIKPEHCYRCSFTETNLLVQTLHSPAQASPNFSVPNERCHHLTVWQMAPFAKWRRRKINLTSSVAFTCSVCFMWTQDQSLNSKTGGKNWYESGVYSGFGGILFRFQLNLRIAKIGLTIFIWKTTQKLIRKILHSPGLYLLTDSQIIPFCIILFSTSFPLVSYFARWPAQRGNTKIAASI